MLGPDVVVVLSVRRMSWHPSQPARRARSSEQGANPIRILPAAPEPHAATKLDHVAPRLVAPDRHDAVHRHDRRAVNPNEACGVELIFRLLHRPTAQV